MNIRIGIGYDIHQFKKGRKLILGGMEIPYRYGLDGHSDADVILHALSDAILGACGLGDIGKHFPSSNPKYKNISSEIILKKVYQKCQKKGYKVINADTTIIAEEPKISPYRQTMQRRIGKILDTSHISIKATTNEKLGHLGQKKGIACFSVVLLSK